MSSRKDLAILKQVRQGDEENKCVLENGTGCADPAVALDGGWTEITENVPAEDILINQENRINISREWPPSRSPLL